ncbi:hypothetical protein Hanom_Chr04g00371591 [Helianthus anomalus]
MVELRTLNGPIDSKDCCAENLSTQFSVNVLRSNSLCRSIVSYSALIKIDILFKFLQILSATSFLLASNTTFPLA